MNLFFFFRKVFLEEKSLGHILYCGQKIKHYEEAQEPGAEMQDGVWGGAGLYTLATESLTDEVTLEKTPE